MKLRLLQFVSQQYQTLELDRVTIIACQHILPTTFDLFEELFSRGLKPENVFLIGKCYSTHRETFERFKNAGVNISDFSLSFDSFSSFDEQFQNYTEKFFKRILSSVELQKFAKLIILDDGGHLISFANDFLKNFGNIVGIEQTTSGYEKIKSAKLNFPVINVARSKAKLEIESPFIAEVAVQKIDLYLTRYNLKNPNILIIGLGYIGTYIFNLLKIKYPVSGCDIITQKCDFNADYKPHLNKFDVIIGATGISAIQPTDFNLLKKNVLLASISSSDREFSAVFLRQLVPRVENCHDDIKINDIILLNCGFPINFNNGQENESREKIQLTRSLLLESIFEAVTKTFSNNMVNLNETMQEKIIKEFSNMYDSKKS